MMRANGALQTTDVREPIEVIVPTRQTVPFVYASPHSGADYPSEFVAASPLDPLALRKSEDSFVDEIFGAAPEIGAPLLKALFPRAYCDPNREPYELDPAMFEDDLPPFANTTSLRVAGGLGVIARVVSNGHDIYPGKLPFAEAERRISACYRPYHSALSELLASTVSRFGCAVLIDCHSMPSVGGPTDRDQGARRPDIILGDRFGTACTAALTEQAEQVLRDLGYRVARNSPYAGGFSTVHYGCPANGVHALQIELNRALYMDETRIARLPGLARLAEDMAELMTELGRIPQDRLIP